MRNAAQIQDYDGRQGQGCVFWDPINANSMRAAIYDAHTLFREPTTGMKVMHFEVDDR